MEAKISVLVLGPKLSYPQYLRSAQGRFPFGYGENDKCVGNLIKMSPLCVQVISINNQQKYSHENFIFKHLFQPIAR